MSNDEYTLPNKEEKQRPATSSSSSFKSVKLTDEPTTATVTGTSTESFSISDEDEDEEDLIVSKSKSNTSANTGLDSLDHNDGGGETVPPSSSLPESNSEILVDDDEESKTALLQEPKLRKIDNNSEVNNNDEDSNKNNTNEQEVNQNENFNTNLQNPVDEANAGDSSSGSRSFAGQKFVLSGTGTEVYVTHSPSRRTSRLIILLTNSLGLASSNNLRLADEYAKKLKCPVIVPDLFDRDPIRVSGASVPEFEDDNDYDDSNDINSKEINTDGQPIQEDDDEFTEITNNNTSNSNKLPSNGKSKSKFGSSFFANLTLNKIKVYAAGAVKGFMDEMWLAKHTFERTYPQLSNTVAEIIQVYSPQSVAVIGYSFGGRYVLRLLEGSNDEWSSDEDLIAVGACVHPSLVESSDFDVVSKPLMLVYSSDDPILSDKTVRRGISSLQERHVTFDRKVFTSDGGSHAKLPHGFAVAGDYPESIVGDRPNQVINFVSDWIQTHL